MGFEHIVSFLPSATELLYELEIQDKLFGVTHECQYPDDAQKKPRVINSVFDSNILKSKEIDEKNSQLIAEEKQVFVIDEQNLKKANPDLIIAQNICEVCAANTNQIERSLEILNKKPQVHYMDPHNLNEILDSVSELAKILSKEDKGNEIRNSLQKRMDFLKNHNHDVKPVVLPIEWIDPFYTAGHWVPEMIQLAGGYCSISQIGEQSRRMSIDEIQNADPDVIVFMPCGFDTSRTIQEYNENLQANKEWNDIRAVKNHQVFAVDANSYFSKPSIRTILGAEILAKIIHPEVFTNLNVPENSFKLMEKF